MTRWIAVAAVAACGLAIVGAYALSVADKHAQGIAAAIAIPAAVVIFGALVWLGRRKRPGAGDGWVPMDERPECPYDCDHGDGTEGTP